jgi:hypothetical protein
LGLPAWPLLGLYLDELPLPPSWETVMKIDPVPVIVPDSERAPVLALAQSRAEETVRKIRTATAGVGGVAGQKVTAALIADALEAVYYEGRTTSLIRHYEGWARATRWRLVWWIGGGLALTLGALAGILWRLLW